MSDAKKQVEITFDPKQVFCDEKKATIYGIKVELKGKKLVGKCDEAVKKSMSEAGRCE